MISWGKRVLVANATTDYQHNNSMPSVRSAEDEEKYLAMLRKQKDEMNAAMVHTINRTIAMIKSRMDEGKSLNVTQMREVKKAVGFAIGRSVSPEICELAIKAMEMPPKRTKKNWLDICAWRREKDAIWKLVKGSFAVSRKMEEVKK